MEDENGQQITFEEWEYKNKFVNYQAVSWPERCVNAIDYSVDGVQINNYRYPVQVGQKRKGIVYFVHGYGCSLHNHAYLAQMFSQHGYEFCGIDQKGFGLSEGTKGRFEGMESSIDQVQKFNELYAQTFDPNGEAPKFLMGHSLGGAISSLIGCEQDKSDLKYDGLCLLAPFYNFKDDKLIKQMGPLLQMMGNVSQDKLFHAGAANQ